MAQTIDDCPAVGDLNSARVICTSGPFENPYRDTGVVSTLHTVQSSTLRLGSTTVDTFGRGVSITYFYHVDTAQSNTIIIRNITNILNVGSSSVDSLSFTQIQFLDSSGVPVGGTCHQVRFAQFDSHGTLTTTANGNINYTTNQNSWYAFDLSPFHGQTIRIHFLACKPQGKNCRCMTQLQLFCHHIDTVTTQYNCSQGYTHTVPDGFRYQWFHATDPDSILGTGRTFVPHDVRQYSCRLSSDSGCLIATLATRPLTHRETVGQATVTAFDTVEVDTVCRVRYRLESHFSTTVITSAGDTTVISDDTLVSHHWTIDGQRIHDSVTLATLSPGSHTVILYFNRAAHCTDHITHTVFINPTACHYYDSLYSTCPSVYDLGNDRVFCGYGTWSISDSTEYSGMIPSRHTLITTPGYDVNTGNRLRTVPPGENASIRLGNPESGREFESITFLYKVDTTQTNLLILRYAAVLENPTHNPDDQPKFIFRILDSAGVDLDPLCYSAEFVANANLGWSITNSGTLWKDWTTVGVDLRAIHGQTISIRLSTHDCRQGAHYGYAYFTLGCTSSQIATSFCGHQHTFTAPEGFNYSWFSVDDTSTVLSSDRIFSTDLLGEYYCRMDFVGAPAGSHCYYTLNVHTIHQHQLTIFHLDTVDTVDCNLRLRLVNGCCLLTESDADTFTVTPLHNVHYLVDGVVMGTHADTLVVSLSPGHHTLAIVSSSENSTCIDTFMRDMDIDHLCFRHDTLFICPETFPVAIGDSIATHDTVFVFTDNDSVRFLHLISLPQPTSSVNDTIVQNQLPWHFEGVTIADTAGTDTTIVIPGIPPDCDTLVHYRLYVYPNVTDSAFLFLCPDAIPFAVNDSIHISHDTVAVLRGVHGEDSVVHYHVSLLHDSDTILYDTILEVQLPWFFFDTLFTEEVTNHPFHLFNSGGCDSTIHYSLFVFWDGDHCDTTLTFPTLVTPNGDGINDRFVIGGLLENNCFKFNELQVYDRTGQLIWHAHNIASEADFWDPAAHRAPDATYFYVFKAHGVTIHTMRQGIIEVLR